MSARPLTSELEECLRLLIELTGEIEEVLPPYIAAHPEMGLPRHDAAEAQLFFQTLNHRLKSWLDGDGEESGDERLAQLLEAAEQCDLLASALNRHRGDSRLDHAMERFAECLRLASPAFLRWTHGARSGKAPAFLASRAKQVHLDLARLLKSLCVV